MLERKTIRGRDAVVVYLDGNMKPVDSIVAEIAKITYLDNLESVFLTPKAISEG